MAVKKQHQQDAPLILKTLPIFVIILGNLSPVIWPLRLAASELRAQRNGMEIFLFVQLSGKILETSFMGWLLLSSHT